MLGSTLGSMLTRRNAVKVAAAATAFPWIMTRSGLAGAATTANETLGVGVIGVGIRGKRLMAQIMQRDDTRIVGVCDVAGPRLMHAMRMVEQQDGSPCAGYLDFHDLLARTDIDAVIIATPDHQHAFEAVHAANAGKHIYCEKPMTLTVPEGRAICTAVEANGVAFQTGSQQRTEYQRRFVDAVQAVRNGRIGSIERVEVGIGDPPIPCDLPAEEAPSDIDFDRWLGQAPERAYNEVLCPKGVHGHYPKWRAYREYGNGYFADFGAHHYDIAQWGLGADHTGPTRIIVPAKVGDVMPNRGLVLEYADGTRVEHGGRNGITFHGADGWLWVDRGGLEASNDAVLRDSAGVGDVVIPRHKSHMDNWLACIKSGETPVASAEVGHRTASMNELAVIGYEAGESLQWDPVAEHFIGDNADVGNARLRRVTRPGWEVPGA